MDVLLCFVIIAIKTKQQMNENWAAVCYKMKSAKSLLFEWNLKVSFFTHQINNVIADVGICISALSAFNWAENEIKARIHWLFLPLIIAI